MGQCTTARHHNNHGVWNVRKNGMVKQRAAWHKFGGKLWDSAQLQDTTITTVFEMCETMVGWNTDQLDTNLGGGELRDSAQLQDTTITTLSFYRTKQQDSRLYTIAISYHTFTTFSTFRCSVVLILTDCPVRNYRLFPSYYYEVTARPWFMSHHVQTLCLSETQSLPTT